MEYCRTFFREKILKEMQRFGKKHELNSGASIHSKFYLKKKEKKMCEVIFLLYTYNFFFKFFLNNRNTKFNNVSITIIQ